MKSIFLLVFVFSTHAWSDTPRDYSKVYRAVSAKMKRYSNMAELFNELAEDRSDADKAYVHKNQRLLESIKPPMINFSPKGMDWTVDGKSFSFTEFNHNAGKFKLNGIEITVNSEMSFKELGKAFDSAMNQKTNLWNYLVPKAHAVYGLAAIPAFQAIVHLALNTSDNLFVSDDQDVQKRMQKCKKFASILRKKLKGQDLKADEDKLIFGNIVDVVAQPTEDGRMRLTVRDGDTPIYYTELTAYPEGTVQKKPGVIIQVKDGKEIEVPKQVPHVSGSVRKMKDNDDYIRIARKFEVPISVLNWANKDQLKKCTDVLKKVNITVPGVTDAVQ